MGTISSPAAGGKADAAHLSPRATSSSVPSARSTLTDPRMHCGGALRQVALSAAIQGPFRVWRTVTLSNKIPSNGGSQKFLVSICISPRCGVFEHESVTVTSWNFKLAASNGFCEMSMPCSRLAANRQFDTTMLPLTKCSLPFMQIPNAVMFETEMQFSIRKSTGGDVPSNGER